MSAVMMRAAPCAAPTRAHARRHVAAAQACAAPRLAAAAPLRAAFTTSSRRVTSAGARRLGAVSVKAQQAVAGSVREVEAKEWRALQSAGWVLLDVRRAEEVSRAAVQSSVRVPLFEVDDDRSLFGLLKQWADFGTGGWWHGTAHTKANTNFLADVQAQVPKTAPGVLVTCQTGVRSLAASEQLRRAGYTNVAWLEGGFDKSSKADFDTTNGKSMRYGGVGGLAGAMGWTKVQEQEEPGTAFAGGPMRVIAYIAVLAALDYAWIGYDTFVGTGK